MKTNPHIFWVLVLVMTGSCGYNQKGEALSVSSKFRTETALDSAFDEGELIKIHKTINMIRISDDKVVTSLYQINNVSNDYKTALTSGAVKEKGFHDFLLDSLSYDKEGNLIVKRMYRNKNGQWIFTQETVNNYNEKSQLIKFTTERPDSLRYVKQVFTYKYNQLGLMTEEAFFECSGRLFCDSVFKTKYHYNKQLEPESTESFIWEKNRWTTFKRNRR